jgi:hypothetical protein
MSTSVASAHRDEGNEGELFISFPRGAWERENILELNRTFLAVLISQNSFFQHIVLHL